MNNSEFNDYLDQHIALLPTDGTVFDSGEAERRAFMFLRATLESAKYEEAVNNGVSKGKSVRDAIFAEKLNSAMGKDAKAREANAKADQDYIMAREELERAENRLKLVQTGIKVFDSAHVTFRQVANRGVSGDSPGGRH